MEVAEIKPVDIKILDDLVKEVLLMESRPPRMTRNELASFNDTCIKLIKVCW